MILNKRKIILGIGTIFSIVPIAITISCGDDGTKKTPYKNKKEYDDLNKHKFSKKDQEFNLDSLPEDKKGFFYNAEIVRWIDGDTPKVNFLDVDSKNNINIRISNIDTPELHEKNKSGSFVKTKGEEYKMANDAKIFGDKEMPVGTKIKIYTSWRKSYNRVVGSIFYKKDSNNDKYKSYSVEIIRNGLAMPFVKSNDFAGLNFSSENSTSTSIFDYVGWALADAYNYAVKEKKGIFSDGANDALKIHGSTDTSFVDWREGEPGVFDSPNIYEVMKVTKEDI